MATGVHQQEAQSQLKMARQLLNKEQQAVVSLSQLKQQPELAQMSARHAKRL